MTRIERAVKAVSDLRDFYLRIKKPKGRRTRNNNNPKLFYREND